MLSYVWFRSEGGTATGTFNIEIGQSGSLLIIQYEAII